MGVMRFSVHPAELLDEWPEAHAAYIGGSDGRVYQTQVQIEDGVLTCRRRVSESGKLYVAWPVAGFGKPVIASTTLPERDPPYVLAVELARGKLSQLRDQIGRWDLAGVTVPDEVRSLERQAFRLFTESVQKQSDPGEASARANEALAKACEAADRLIRRYSALRLAQHRHQPGQLPVSLGCNLGGAPPSPEWEQQFVDAFDAALVPIEWRRIESVEGVYEWELNDAQVTWCRQQRLMLLGGPLFDLAPDGLPDWLHQWEDDLPNLQSFVCDFVETAVSRYAGKIRIWEVSARANTGGALRLNDEQRLMLTARAVDVAQQVDEECRLLIRVDQPWGEYQARGNHQVTPLQFVDALLRSGIGLDGVNLEIGVSYRPRGSAFRDLLDFARLIDLWSSLGVPLYVTMAVPSATGPDPEVTSELDLDLAPWKSTWNEQLQAEWVDSRLPLLMAKETVVGIFWAHFTDGAPHYFPHAGLLRGDHSPKPALERLIAHRRS